MGKQSIGAWGQAVRQELAAAEELAVIRQKEIAYRLCRSRQALWIVPDDSRGPGIAVLAACAPGGIERLEMEDVEGGVRVDIVSSIGRQRVTVGLLGRQRPVLTWTTRLTPSLDCHLAGWPRDLVPVDREGKPTDAEGRVHAWQRTLKAGLLYASGSGGASPEVRGTFLYLQNLTELNDYFGATHTSPCSVIGHEWPELGYRPPVDEKRPLPANCEITISQGLLVRDEAEPRQEGTIARLFIELLADIYYVLPKPQTLHRHWPQRVDATICDLTHSTYCSREVGGKRYFNAYVGADDRPAESMVQLAILVPLIEYVEWSGADLRIVEGIMEAFPPFFDKEIGTVVRWLPSEYDLLDGQEEHMRPYTMDSWYLYHTLLNLSRVAQKGEKKAMDLLLDSLPFAMRIARHFDYRWPIFYDLRTLEVLKQESEPGLGGENDCGGLYAQLMLNAYELTGEEEYLEEARRAGDALEGLGFELTYQLNNTAFTAGAMMKLWLTTKERRYRDLVDVALANVFQNVWLWECNYGVARYYQTFFGIPPLRDGSYLAIFEELETLAALEHLVGIGYDELTKDQRYMIGEFCKHCLDRLWYHYPDELPFDILAEKVKSGILHRSLSIPIEDIPDGWGKPGTVGQEIYGASAPMTLAVRHSLRLPGSRHYLYWTYPTGARDLQTTKRGKTTHFRFSFRVLGERRGDCILRIVPEGEAAMPTATLRWKSGGRSRTEEGTLSHLGWIEFRIPGDAEVVLEMRQKDEASLSLPRDLADGDANIHPSTGQGNLTIIGTDGNGEVKVERTKRDRELRRNGSGG